MNIFYILLLFTELQLCSFVSIDFTYDVLFLLHTKNLGKYPEVLTLDTNIFKYSDFKASRKTVFLIHEWGTGQRSVHLTPIKNAYLKSKTHNVNLIVVDWHNEAMMPYSTARKLTSALGEYVSKFIQFLLSDGNVKASDIHIYGFGIGAHIAGNAARRIKTIDIITAINPEENMFSEKSLDALKPTDARCVNVLYFLDDIHSSSFIKSIGTASFFLSKIKTEKFDYNLSEYYSQFILTSNTLKVLNDSQDVSNEFILINSIDFTENGRKCIEGHFNILK